MNKIFFLVFINLILLQPNAINSSNPKELLLTNELAIKNQLNAILNPMPKELTQIIAGYARDLTDKEQFEFDNKDIIEEFIQLSQRNREGVFVILSLLISMDNFFIYDIQLNLVNSHIQKDKAPLIKSKIVDIVKQIRKIVLDQRNKRITSVTKKRLSKKPILKQIDKDSKEKIKTNSQFALDFLIYIQTIYPEVLKDLILSNSDSIPIIGYQIKDFSNKTV